MKYIIKNCPNYLPEFFYLGACKCEKGDICNGEYVENCKDITDCLLKQIVAKCEKVDCDCIIDKRKCGAMNSMSMCCELFVKKDILNLLEIEEIND